MRSAQDGQSVRTKLLEGLSQEQCLAEVPPEYRYGQHVGHALMKDRGDGVSNRCAAAKVNDGHFKFVTQDLVGVDGGLQVADSQRH